MPQELLNSFEGDSVAVHLTNLLSPLPDLCVLPVLTQETKPAERTMNGKAPRRPRESKRRRCAFVVGEECGNVPAPCQTSLKGVRPHSAGVGKPGRDGAHTRRARLQLHRPIRGYMEEKKTKKERKKGENPKKSVVLEGYITRLPLSYDPPFPIIHPLPSTHKLEVRVCARKFAYGPPPPPPPPPPPVLDFGVCLGWCSLRGWGVRACTVNYLCGPGMEESGQGCI